MATMTNTAPMFNSFGFGNTFANTAGFPAFGNQWANQDMRFLSRDMIGRNNRFARITHGQMNSRRNSQERSPEERMWEFQEEEHRRREEEEGNRETEERRGEEQDEFEAYMEEMETKRKERIIGGRESTTAETIAAAALVGAGWAVLPEEEAEVYTIDQYAQAGLDELMIPFVPRAIMIIILNHLLLTYQYIYSSRTRQFINDACSLPAEAGTGAQSVEKFYFDPADKTCKTFTYSGLGGNENRFEKAVNCYVKCDPTGTQGRAVLSERINKDHVFTVIEFLQHRGGVPEPMRVLTQLLLLSTLE